MSKLPQIAVIGCGAWGRQHVRVLRELGALRWVYDANPQALVGIPERTSFIEKALEDPQVDGVVIATPPRTHFELGQRVALSNKAALIEKPMATSTKEVECIRIVAEQKGTILMVGHLMRYHSGFVKLLDQVQSGAIGDIEYVYSHRLQPGRVRTDSSSLWQLAPHDVSMMIAVAGMPTAITCKQGVSRAGLADIVTATMNFPGSASGHFFVSWLHPTKQREFTVIGSKGALTMEQNPEREPLRVELEHFLECIRTSAQPLTDGADGLRVVEVLSACEESMKDGL